MDFLDVETLLAGLGSAGIIAVAAVLGVIGAIYGVVSSRKRMRDPEVLAAADRQAEKRRGWVQGAGFILQRGWDNAYIEPGIIGPNLQGGWGISSANDLQQQVSDLLSQDDNAWALLRAVSLLRSAVAMGWMSNDESLQRCYEVGARLQRRYPSWEAMSTDVLRSRREWAGLPMDGSADTEGMTEVVESARELAKTHWRQIPWQLDLSRAA